MITFYQPHDDPALLLDCQGVEGVARELPMGEGNLAAGARVVRPGGTRGYSMSNMCPVLLLAATPSPEKPGQQDQDRKPSDPQENHPSALPVAIHMIHEPSSVHFRTPTEVRRSRSGLGACRSTSGIGIRAGVALPPEGCSSTAAESTRDSWSQALIMPIPRGWASVSTQPVCRLITSVSHAGRRAFTPGPVFRGGSSSPCPRT